MWDNAAAWTMRLYIKRHDNELRPRRTTYKVVCGVTITSASEKSRNAFSLHPFSTIFTRVSNVIAGFFYSNSIQIT